jgi:hypothetical protein
MGGGGARQGHDSGGLPVDTVHDPETVTHLHLEEAMEAGVGWLSTRGHHGQAGRLLRGQDGLVLVQEADGHGAGR